MDLFDKAGRDFSSMFYLMFSEGSNVLFEESLGYQIKKTTYGECRERIFRRAASLAGVPGLSEPDSIVGIHMENSVDWIELFWSVLMIGCRPLLMNTRLGHDILEDALSSCRAVCVISETDTFSVHTLRPADIPCADDPYPFDRFGSDILVMSSGTSSHIKICAYGCEQFYAQIRDSYDIIRRCSQIKKHCRGELKLLTFLPFYHIFGLVAVYIWFAFFSRTFVLLRDFSAQTILNTIRRHSVTHIFAVPMLWEKTYDEAMRTIHARGGKTEERFRKGERIARRLIRIPAVGPALCRRMFREIRENLFGDSVLFTISGGSFIRPETLWFFNMIGYYLCNGYGMSEIGIASVELSRNAAVRSSGSVGSPMSSLRFRTDADGRLEVSGRSIAKAILCDGVWNETADSWYMTGDLAEQRGSRWFLSGRSDDVVIGAAGENLNPNLLEPRLKVDGCADLCLVGGDGLPPTLICSVPPFSSDDAVASVREALIAKLDELHLTGQIPGLIITRQPLMAESDFKVSRTQIRKRCLSGELKAYQPEAAASFDTASDSLLARVCELMAVASGQPGRTVRPDEDFFLGLGGTSLDYYTLAGMIEEEFHIALPAVTDLGTVTPGAVAEAVRKGGAA